MARIVDKFLVFDLGTTLFKVCLFDDSGKLLGVERAAPPIEHPRPGSMEMDVAEFMRTLKEATERLRFAVGEQKWTYLAAVSFATQANSFTFLDHMGVATMKFILWPDERAASMKDELASIAKIPGYRGSTGMPRFGTALALAKIAWLVRQQPELLKDAEMPCFLSDFLGGGVSEAGVAGLSGALDIHSLRWRDDILARVGIGGMRMPRVVRAGTDLGHGFGNLGLPRSCRRVVGCLDQYAGAIGTGTIEPGQVCETTGTVLAAVRCSDCIDITRPDDVFHGPAFDEGKFFQMSFTSTSANLLEWYRNTLPDRPSFEELSRLAAEADDAVTIEPYREGQPIEICFTHVRPEHSVGQVVRGIMRCVAEALKRQVQSLSPTSPTVIRSAGGAARSDLWLQMKANVLGIPFEAMECEEPTSLGAAMLAARALGHGELPDIAKRWVKVRRKFTPRA